jgi:L-arabinonolactonase
MQSMRVISKTPALLGESPVWDDWKQRLFWVDIEAGKLFCVTLEGEETCWVLPERVGSLGLTTGVDIVVLALETGFAFFDLETGRLDRIPMPQKLPVDVRFNDGKCDQHGNFWAGTMSEANPPEAVGCLYRLSPDGSVATMQDGIRVSNSIAWSLDGSRMYFADSLTKTIIKRGVQHSASERPVVEVFVGPGAFSGVPDGSTVDLEDRLWTAEWDGWRILVHDQDGLLVKVTPLDVQRPTSCCFGGVDFATLFVTTATTNLAPEILKDQPAAGMVLAIEGLGKGRSADRFQLL